MGPIFADRVPVPDGPLYVTIDLDALDPAFAPGVSHPEPAGLSVRDIVTTLARIRSRVVGADIVELNPLRDVSDATAVVAVKLLKELAAVAGANARPVKPSPERRSGVLLSLHPVRPVAFRQRRSSP